MNQSWLNITYDPYVFTVSPALLNQKVASLCSTGTKEWDWKILNDIFGIIDQQAILNTTVEHDLDKDVLRWNLEHSGHYTIKSACRLLQKQKGAWNANNNTDFWKSLWTIKAPSCVINLIWRATMYAYRL